MNAQTDAAVPAPAQTGGRPAGPFLFGAGLVLASGVLLTQVFAIPADGFSPEGPRFFPLVVISLLLVLSLAYLVQQLKAVRAGGSLPAEPFTHMVAAATLIGLLVGYAFVLGPVGYVPATSVFFVLAARTMGSRHLPRDVVVRDRPFARRLPVFTRGLGIVPAAGVLPL